jgi:hypothetical protein
MKEQKAEKEYEGQDLILHTLSLIRHAASSSFFLFHRHFRFRFRLHLNIHLYRFDLFLTGNSARHRVSGHKNASSPALCRGGPALDGVW